ncbi:MAG TPA: ABC transporter permease/substrate-binding protein [Vicinamibacterales bacterium]|nr:ABC transporter permease/substrate-binding protein [Vicinamibacterales bacterium]
MSALFEFFATHRAELAARLGEHVVLVLASTAIAAAIGIPLGILAARRPSLSRPIVAIANLAQTIPSLALFGFLIPLPLIGGIGTRTALVALTVYAVLPILRSTITGLQGVAPSVIECAMAMGLTPRQVLWRVEWPLALPSVVSGLRVAVVIGVGTATIASAIGAGGLGDYIFRGLAMVDGTVILAGALPAALLAIAADAVLALAGRAADPRRRRPAVIRVLIGVVIVVAAAAVWASTSRLHGNRGDRIVVGSKNFTEQVVLGELLAQLIERETGVGVERRLNLGGTAIAHRALLSGGIDLYVEYSGTALTAIFNQPPATDSDTVFRDIRDRYAAVGLSALPRLGFNNTFAILVRRADAERYSLKTIGDLNKVRDWRAGFGYEFLERPDGFKGLAAAYGLRFANQPRVMDLNLIYRALASDEIDVTAGDATSGLIDALDLVILEDDRHYFPVYDAIPVARATMVLQHPDIADVLRGLEGRISAAAMQRMNYAVDGEKRDPAQVARTFLDTIDRFHVQPR